MNRNEFKALFRAPLIASGILFNVFALSFGYEIHLTNRNTAFQFNPADYQLKTNNVIFTMWAFKFPYYDRNGNPVNGGLPQYGDMPTHFAQLDYAINYLIPDPSWKGLTILDFEDWWDTWNLTRDIYHTQSKNKVRSEHPTWTDAQIEAQAIIEYEAAAKYFLQETLKRGKQLRPNVKWGYYGAPAKVYYDTTAPDGVGYPDEIKRENDKMDWLWQESTALFPSIYQFYTSNNDDARFGWNETYISGVLDEANRVSARVGGRPIYSYIYHRYHPSGNSPGNLCSYRDMDQQIRLSAQKGLAGSVLWTETGWFAGTIAQEEINLKSYLDSTLAAIIDTYIPRIYTITVSAGSNGAISPAGAISVTSGQSKTFSITPNSGYEIDTVMVNGTNIGAVTTYTFSNVTNSQTINATFRAIPPTPPPAPIINSVTATRVNITSVTFTVVTDKPTQAKIMYGTNINLSSSTNWSVAYANSADITLLNLVAGGLYYYKAIVRDQLGNTVESNIGMIRLLQNPKPAVVAHLIKSAKNKGGTISPLGDVSVVNGTDQTFTITPDTGYAIKSVLIDQEDQGAILNYTFKNIQSDHSIQVVFEMIPQAPTIDSPVADAHTRFEKFDPRFILSQSRDCTIPFYLAQNSSVSLTIHSRTGEAVKVHTKPISSRRRELVWGFIFVKQS
jgi:hypothetical protein